MLSYALAPSGHYPSERECTLTLGRRRTGSKNESNATSERRNVGSGTLTTCLRIPPRESWQFSSKKRLKPRSAPLPKQSVNVVKQSWVSVVQTATARAICTASEVTISFVHSCTKRLRFHQLLKLLQLPRVHDVLGGRPSSPRLCHTQLKIMQVSSAVRV